MTILTTDRLTLRPIAAKDIDAMAAFYMSERSAMTGGNVPLFQAVTISYAMLGHWAHRGYGLFAITKTGDDTALGMVGPYFPLGRPETEIGWVLFDGAEGHGYATEAAKATIDYARTALGWTEIVHYINTENAASVAVAKRLGAVLDPSAQQPKPDTPCFVYRQPQPEHL